MSFLYNDEILKQLYAFEKQAQETIKPQDLVQDQELQQVMHQLASGLRDVIYTKTSDIYVKDLADLQSYIAFLYKEKIQFQGKQIVLNQQPSADANLYIVMNSGNTAIHSSDANPQDQGGWIFMDGLKAKLTELETKTQNNSVAQPFVNNLFEEFNQIFNANLIRGQAQNSQNTNSQQLPNGNFSGQQSGQGNNFQQVSFKSTNTESDTVVNQNQEEELATIMKFTPFDNDTLNPLDMYQFVLGMHRVWTIIQKQPLPQKVELDERTWKPKLNPSHDPIMIQFENASRSMSQAFLDWNNFINDLNTKKDKEGNPIAPGILMHRDKDAYRKTTSLDIASHDYGSGYNAKQAMNKLLTMVRIIDGVLSYMNSTSDFKILMDGSKGSKIKTMSNDSEIFKRKLTTDMNNINTTGL